jgi:hypothetical protein
MSLPKFAINGFGRTGRIVTRIAKLRRHFEVVAINDITDPVPPDRPRWHDIAVSRVDRSSG